MVGTCVELAMPMRQKYSLSTPLSRKASPPTPISFGCKLAKLMCSCPAAVFNGLVFHRLVLVNKEAVDLYTLMYHTVLAAVLRFLVRT